MKTSKKCLSKCSPDLVLLDFLSQERAPADPDLRLDVVKLALARIASARGYGRLSRVFLHGGLDVVKALVLAASHVREGAVSWLLQDNSKDYERALKLLGVVVERSDGSGGSISRTALADETLLRVIEVGGDVLDWDSADDASYVAAAWPVLADEVEYEREGGDDEWLRLQLSDRGDDAWSYGGPTRRQLGAMEAEDLRYARCED